VTPVGPFAVATANLAAANAAIEIGGANGNRVVDQAADTLVEVDPAEALDPAVSMWRKRFDAEATWT